MTAKVVSFVEVVLKHLMILMVLGLLGACGGGSGTPSTPLPVAPSSLSYASPQTLTAGIAMAPISPSITGTVAGYSVSPALPAGLSINACTGVIAGLPAVATAVANYTVTAQNAGGSTTFSLAMTVNAPLQSLLEPGSSQTIARGQSIRMYFVQRGGGALYPRYIDPTLVSWSSSDPARLSVNAAGVITGVSEGGSTITAQYQGFTLALGMQVSGAFVQRTVLVAGQGLRRYTVYEPAAASGLRPALIAMHGGGGSSQNIAETSLLVLLAQQHGIYLALPEGSGLVQTFR